MEERDLIAPSTLLEDRIRQVLLELLRGPELLNYTPIPSGTSLIGLFMDDEGIAYLDLSEEVRKNHPGGTSGEIMTIYSLVNTVIDNFHTIKGVKLLIMGKEIETLKGHIDTRYPFTLREKP